MNINYSTITTENKISGAIKQDLAREYPSSVGWVTLPADFPAQALEAIEKAADDISSKCRYFVVVGVGGSYLGSRA